MTGRELIIYILENNLEDEQIFKDGTFVGLITDIEAAYRLKVGVESIRVLYETNMLQGITIGSSLYIFDGGANGFKTRKTN